MKKSILALFALVAVATSAYAQEEGSRSLSVYVCGNTGTLNQVSGWEKGDFDRTFSKNWTEFGLVYDHSFDNGFGFDVSIVGTGDVSTDNEYNADKESFSTVLGGYNMGAPYAKVGVSYGIAGFSTYLSLETTALAAAGVDYRVSFGAAGAVSVGTDVCFFVAPQAIYAEEYDEDEKEYFKYVDGSNVLDFYQAYVGYSVSFAQKWGFNTKAMFRFTDDASADAFVDSFYVRWDNTVSYKAFDNLSFYGRVRYQAFDIATDADVDHRVSLQAGLTYSFDL